MKRRSSQTYILRNARRKDEKLSFQKTVEQLWEETEITEVYAANAYGLRDGKQVFEVGIRRQIAGFPERDPIIGDVPFMIAGDVRFLDKTRKPENVRELIEAGADHLTVSLRANVMMYRFSKVELGEFHVEYIQRFAPEVVKLFLRRKR